MHIQESISGKAQLVAMVHVHSSNAFSNTKYNSLFNVKTFSGSEALAIDSIRKELKRLSNQIIEETGNELFAQCRSASFVLKKNELLDLEEQISRLVFVQHLIVRALHEVEIYFKNGITCVEVENVGAPYFIGNEIPLEELLILHVVAKAIRKSFPTIKLGIQVLSCGELEALPIAIANSAFFVRSESSLFKGLRPEGETNNKGNLAKFYFLRNYLLSQNDTNSQQHSTLPALWCDFQKKHTVFNDELSNLQTWLNTALFQKIEGIVLTGAETGADSNESDLELARNTIHLTQKKIKQLSGSDLHFEIPLITGSGANIEMYRKYADYIILGTSLKKNNYWENEVDERLVKAMVARF